MVKKTVVALWALFGAEVMCFGANTWYVSTMGDGTDPSAGFATGYSSLKAAVEDARTLDDDTILLDRGTFAATGSITLNKRLTIRGVGEAWETVYDGLNKAYQIYVTKDGCFLSNFTLTRCGTLYNEVMCVKMSSASVISNVIATSNGNSSGADSGTRFTFIISKGLLTSSIITNNSSWHAPGIDLSGSGIVENCYIANNTCRATSDSGYNNGTAVRANGGTVRNCTIIDNAGRKPAVYVGKNTARFYNNVIWRNTLAASQETADWYSESSDYTATWSNNCTTAVAALGADAAACGNFEKDPLIPVGEMSFMTGSPCQGAALASAAPAYDIFGALRPEKPSVGCAEYKLPDSLVGVMNYSGTLAVAPATITLSVTVGGSYTGELDFEWELDDTEGVDATGREITLSKPGIYHPKCVVTDEVGKSVVISPSIAEFGIYGEYIYVSASDNPDAKVPYDTKAKAASTIEDALAIAPYASTIILLDGEHKTSTCPIVIDKKITLRSENGKDAVTLRPKSNGRVLTIRDGVVDGVTIANHRGGTFGNYGVVVVANGAFRNSKVDNCTSFGRGVVAIDRGSGTSDGARIENCEITRCWDGDLSRDDQASVVVTINGDVKNAVVEGCLIANNSIDYKGDNGVLNSVYLGGAINISSAIAPVIRNNTIVSNQWNYGGLIHIGNTSAVTIENNIISGNYRRVFDEAGNLTELVADNEPLRNQTEALGVGELRFNCIYPAKLDYAEYVKIITEDPKFKDPANSDYRLRTISPCYNAGDKDVVSVLKDLDGMMRVKYGKVDMGAYESQTGRRTVIILR